jgi:ABC-type multidrug transport system ATPase subunit
VGDPGEWGLSIEQRKRLTIAVELVANPSLVFMDEPTSGLDARAAAIVMRAVRNTVNTGRTVVCTIHQPSIDIIDVSANVCITYSHVCLFSIHDVTAQCFNTSKRHLLLCTFILEM